MGKLLFRLLLIPFLFLSLYSCTFGPQPDKIIRATVEFDEDLKFGNIEVVEIFKKRIGKISNNFKVEKIANRNQIMIEFATHYDSDRAKKLLITQGDLNFYEAYKVDEITPFFEGINDFFNTTKDQNISPIFDITSNKGRKGGAVLLTALEKDTLLINEYLSLEELGKKLPTERRFVKFVWGRKEKYTNSFSLYALKLSEQLKPAIRGGVIEQARQEFNQMSDPTITFKMNEEGSKQWEDLTGKAFKNHFQIAIVVDNEVYSAPSVATGSIKGGMSEINGGFTLEEAQDLANILNSGSIPKVNIVSFNVEKLK
ncbi:SecDF P1 head subdomain-containing protein [Aquimarina sediminis]|uniref:SecDF P1 head subdomain-containing protein n=1 Tax=Aquimarina sediminis TaxID=2070536 RepID=UPI000CA000F8|nr:hypothetical protein [Aquimarina sediminis]